MAVPTRPRSWLEVEATSACAGEERGAHSPLGMTTTERLRPMFGSVLGFLSSRSVPVNHRSKPGARRRHRRHAACCWFLFHLSESVAQGKMVGHLVDGS